VTSCHREKARFYPSGLSIKSEDELKEVNTASCGGGKGLGGGGLGPTPAARSHHARPKKKKEKKRYKVFGSVGNYGESNLKNIRDPSYRIWGSKT